MGLLLLLLCQTPDASKAHLQNLIEWWKKDQAYTIINLTEEEREQLVYQLDRKQYKYQIAQTRLNAGLIKVKTLYTSADLDEEAIRKVFKETIEPARIEALNNRFEANLTCRRILGKERFDTMLEQFPRFLRARWFRNSKIPVMPAGEIK